MKNGLRFSILIFFICQLFLTKSSVSQTIYIQGSQSGLLSADTIYVTGNVLVAESESLEIEAGTKVLFTGFFRFDVRGSFRAIGDITDWINFEVSDTTGFSNPQSVRGAWDGFHFLQTTAQSDSSVFEFCSFRYTKALGDSLQSFGGVFNIRNFSNIRIENCLFKNNYAHHWGGALFGEFSDIMIHNTVFEENNCGQAGPPYGYGGAVCFRYSQPYITSCIFNNNSSTGVGGGVSLEYSDAVLDANLFSNNFSALGGAFGYIRSTPEKPVTNNVFTQNQCMFFGGAIAFLRANPLFLHNTVSYNSSWSYGGGIYFNDSAVPVLVNNIVYFNQAGEGQQVYIWDILSSPEFHNCNVEGGKEAFGGTGGIGYSAAYENNLDADPVFAGNGEYPLSITSESPCVDSGSLLFINNYYPVSDFAGNPRISSDIPDIGAFEFQLVNKIFIPEITKKIHAFPNPFTEFINIASETSALEDCIIEIYNSNGTQVFSAAIPSASYSYQWKGESYNGEILGKGIYFIRIIGKNTVNQLSVIKL